MKTVLFAKIKYLSHILQRKLFKKIILLAPNYQSLPHMLNTVCTQTTHLGINSDRELNMYIHTLWICNNNALDPDICFIC